MKKMTNTFLAAILLLSLLTGCSSNSSTTETAANTEAESTAIAETTTQAATGDVNQTFADFLDSLESMFDDCNQYYLSYEAVEQEFGDADEDEIADIRDERVDSLTNMAERIKKMDVSSLKDSGLITDADYDYYQAICDRIADKLAAISAE